MYTPNTLELPVYGVAPSKAQANNDYLQTIGMQTVWVFGDAAQIVEEIPQPYVEGYLTYGGSAYGNDTYDPLVVPWFGLGPSEPPSP